MDGGLRAMSGDMLPTLWQIDVSHFSEKARWALAWKGVEHKRHSPVPGAHMVVAAWLTRGRQVTLPVLEIDGRRIGDSTAIVAALEQLYPEPPLYPDDPAERRRALELEDFFDEQLGPYVRQLAWHEFGNDRERFHELMKHAAPPPLSRMPGAAAAYARLYTTLRFRAGDKGRAEQSRIKVLAALDRLEAELGDREYLVGERFSIADLTAASLFYPLVQPPEGPMPPDQPAAEGFERFREPLRPRRGFQWVAEMFHRHRKPARPVVPVTA
ncbi:MAG TPA: glutathione S-transferase [Solirubrobacterales bacterium]|nr:glutathione S-transferase [Solirubrobacterales bacterium]